MLHIVTKPAGRCHIPGLSARFHPVSTIQSIRLRAVAFRTPHQEYYPVTAQHNSHRPESARQNPHYCERAVTVRFFRSFLLHMNNYAPQIIVPVVPELGPRHGTFSLRRFLPCRLPGAHWHLHGLLTRVRSLSSTRYRCQLPQYPTGFSIPKYHSICYSVRHSGYRANNSGARQSTADGNGEG